MTALASPPTRVSGEFQVNSYTTESQEYPVVALDASGGFVIAWKSDDQDGYAGGMFARRFDAAGVAQGAEFRVNSYTATNQIQPVVAMSDDIFLVTWASQSQDGSEGGIFARRFQTKTGAFLGVEFQVNSLTSLLQFQPTAAMESNGDFVIAWQDEPKASIFAKRFNSSGAAQGVELQVGSDDTGDPSNPTVAMSATGAFVVAWKANGRDGDGGSVFARRFNSGGVPQGGEFQVNSYTPGEQGEPAVDLGAHGDFVIAWSSSGGHDGNGSGVFARRFSATGVGLGGQFQVNSYTTGSQTTPAVAIEDNGSFAIVWESNGQDGSNDGVFARRFNSEGGGLGAEFQVNAYTSGIQQRPTVGAGGVGDLVVSWESYTQDGSGMGVFAQRFTSLVVLDVDNNGVVEPLTDALLFLRFAFDFTGTNLTASAVGAGCTRCSSGTILPYLTGLTAPTLVTRLGSELQVNTYTSLEQTSPVVRMAGDGDFVVAWSGGPNSTSYDVFARRFNSAGVGVGNELQVNAYTSNAQALRGMGMDSDGDFVLAWQSEGQDGDSGSVFARRFDSAGGGLGGELQINARTSGSQRAPAVATDGDGDFVVAWQSNEQDGSGYGVFARRFNSAGIGQGGEFQVNSFTPGGQADPTVGVHADGGFVIVWESFGQDASGFGVFARRFNSAGVGLGAELQVNTYTAANQRYPAAGIDDDGDFVVAWQSLGQDGDVNGIFARRFNSAGVGVGPELQVNAYTASNERFPAVDMGGNGDFVVAWERLLDGGHYDVFARRFDSGGTAVNDDFLVNTYTSNNQSLSSVSTGAGGDFVVAWASYAQDGSHLGVFAQRYATLSVVDIDGNGAFEALNDAILILRYLFDFTGANLVSGAVDTVGCTRCDAATIEAYLQTLD